MVLVVRYRSPEDAAERWLLKFHIRYGFPWTSNSPLFEWLDRVFWSWKLRSIDQVNDFEWSPRSALQISSFPEHLFKAVVKQPERLEAKTFELGCLGQQHFILWSSWAYQSWSKLWMMKSAWASTNTYTILFFNLMTPGNWFRITYINQSQEWNQEIWREHIHWVKITHSPCRCLHFV